MSEALFKHFQLIFHDHVNLSHLCLRRFTVDQD